MKVFELMNELSKVPAGAEVRFSMITSVEELVKAEPEEMEGKIYYRTDVDVKEVDAASEKTVFIYH